MRVFRARFVALLQCLAAVLVSSALMLPAPADAASKKATKSTTKVVEKKKSKREPVATKKASRTNTAAASKRDKTVRSAKRNTRVSKQQLASSTSSRSKVAKGKTLELQAKRGAEVRLVSHSRSVSSIPVTALESRVSNGQRMGLHSSSDPLDLNSSVALVVDQLTNEVLFSKNDSAVLPIASLTKLMTGLVVTDANLPMEELITITPDDVDTVKGSRSRLSIGTTLSRRELMHLALMSSENRAAHALGRSFPGGLDHFVRLMNAKARELGMSDTRYVEPTGLSSLNQSSARDLATLVSVAYQRPILRSLSTSPSHQLDVGNRVLEYRNSNGLIRNPDWDIGLQKTGYISEAGRCLVMQARVAGRQLIMVFLDASGKLGRAQDAERVRRWVEAQPSSLVPARPQG